MACGVACDNGRGAAASGGGLRAGSKAGPTRCTRHVASSAHSPNPALPTPRHGFASPFIHPTSASSPESAASTAMDQSCHHGADEGRRWIQPVLAQPLHALSSAHTFFTAIRAELEQNHKMYRQQGILQHGITPWRILAATEQPSDGNGVDAGFLFNARKDLRVEPARDPETWPIDGYTFDAVSVLCGYRYSYRASLESIFYAICYACCLFPGDTMPPPSPPPVPKTTMEVQAYEPPSYHPGRIRFRLWQMQGGFGIIAKTKIDTLGRVHRFTECIVMRLTNKYRSTGPLLLRLRACVAQSKWFSCWTGPDSPSSRYHEIARRSRAAAEALFLNSNNVGYLFNEFHYDNLIINL